MEIIIFILIVVCVLLSTSQGICDRIYSLYKQVTTFDNNIRNKDDTTHITINDDVKVDGQCGPFDAVSQYNLAVVYEEGKHEKKCYKEAAYWYRRAAEQGLPVAQRHLARMYKIGLGVEQSDEEAIKWYRLAADQGESEAQHNLGVMYEKGIGVEQNIQEAINWYSKASRRGFNVSQDCLNILLAKYEHPKDNKTSKQFVKLTTENSCPHIKSNDNIVKDKVFVHNQKKDWEKIDSLLKNYRINHLYHFTDIQNISSIKDMGGLYSWEELDSRKVIIPRPGGNNLSRQLDASKGLSNYVRLCFTKNHPMKSCAEKEGRISRCVYLEIHPEVIFWQDTKFSNINATDKDAKIGGTYNDFNQIKLSVANKNNWSNEYERKHIQAEVLVFKHIPLKYISNINRIRTQHIQYS